MGLRELKETAHTQYIRGKFELCAQTYQQILRLAPQDPNMHVRHAEACRRAGARQQAITSYRMAANLLLAVGCESRARGALKAALELDPRDPVLLSDISRLGPSGASAPFTFEEERPSPGGTSSAPHAPGPTAGPGRSMTSMGMAAPARPAAATPARSMTSAGVAAPARSMTSAGMAAPGRPMPPAGTAAPARSMTSAGTAAPARSMTSAGTAAPARSMTSAGTTAPARSMTSAGTAAPARSMTSAGMAAPARPVTAAPSRPKPAMETAAPGHSVTAPRRAAVPPTPARLALPAAPAAAPRATPPPTKPGAPEASRPAQRTSSPTGASPGAFASAQGPVRPPPPPPMDSVSHAPRTASGSPPPTASGTAAARPGAEQRVQLRAEVRRLSDHAVAFRLSPQSRWVLFTSAAPIQVRRVDTLPELPDFTVDITVDEDSLH